MSTNRIFITLTLVLTLILSAGTAQAGTFDFTDSVTHWDGWGTARENGTDVIGVPDFTTGSIATTGGDTMTGFSIDYTVSRYFSAFNGLTSGDLFINTDDDTNWNYVVKLDGRDGGVANVYEFNAAYTEAGSYVLGNAAGNFRDNHPASAIVDGLNPVAQVMWSGIADASSGNKQGTITVSGLDIQFDVLSVAYTVSCANDVVFAAGMSKTPIPGAVWLLGSGLFGLIGLRRRNANA